MYNLDQHVCKQGRFACGNAHQGSAFFSVRVQYFLQFYFQRYEYNPSVLAFHLLKLLEILLDVQQSTHLF